jgi:AAA+ lid domain
MHTRCNRATLPQVFQGLLMGGAKSLPSSRHLLRLWVHESTRVFGDRLVSAGDREWFEHQLRDVITGAFRLSWQEVGELLLRQPAPVLLCADTGATQFHDSHASVNAVGDYHTSGRR